MEEWVGIYKGLRLPLLGLVLIGIFIYLYLPKNKKRLEKAKYNMLHDELGDKNEKE